MTVEARDLLTALEETEGALGLLPFDQIDPRFKVLTVDGINILSNRFDPSTYPLVSMLHIRGKEMAVLVPLLADVVSPSTNRNPDALTQLIMTGVTAMSRGTANAIELNYLTYPAVVISETLAAADITHISNEVPFLEDCVVNNTTNNLVLCSHTSYWAVLEAVGTDIVGLSGNHVNDFGYDGARESLTWYRENNIPIYGSGLNVTEACEPLFWEHNGNTFAFVAALAFGPETAWASDELPGACYFYERKDQILELVEELADEVDIVAVELQYLEIYEPSPTFQQVDEFRELRAAGADIVTGVQSHVPQAWETYGNNDPGGPGTITYGLGNLFFDQMWSWETRTEQMARHTLYEGRVLNTEILTAVLEDFAQPRWATPEERADILNRVFNAAPPRPQE
jgi:poly-gamma-glutamate synthesis protein (capsule biosynthesis protein)